MTWWNWVRAGGTTLRGSYHAARATGAVARQVIDASAARRGVLGPGDAPPYGSASTDYFDFRGVATVRDVRLAQDQFLPVGWLVDPRRGRRRRHIALGSADLRQHACVIGPSRSGKTASYIVPWVTAGLRAGYSIIAVDVNGNMLEDIEAYASASATGQSHRVAAWDYRQPNAPPRISWNWLQELADERMIHAAAEALLGRERPGDPMPFFHQRDTRILVGLLSAARKRGSPIRTARDLLQVLSDPVQLDGFARQASDPLVDAALADALYADPADYSKVVSGVVNALQPLAGPDVEQITRDDQLRLDDALDQPGLLLCGAELGGARLGIASSSLLLRMLMQRIYRRRQRLWALSVPVLLVIDEAARLTDRIDYEELLSVSAGAGVTVCLALQDLTQMRRPEDRAAVLTNCGTVICMPGVSPDTAEAFARRLGKRQEVDVSSEHEHGSGWARRTSRRHATVPVLGEREIMAPPFGERVAVAHSRPVSRKPMLLDTTRADLL